MANSFRVVLLLFLSFCTFSEGISVLNETLKCRSQCDRTYALHTYPTVKHNRACQQGCYRAMKMKTWSVLGFRVKNCSEGCKEQYFDQDSVYACKLGCSKGQGVNFLEHSPSKTLASKTPHGTVAALILRPVMLLHTYGRGMINKLTYYVQSSTSYYFRTSNGGMVVVKIQRGPEIYVRNADGYLSSQNDEAQKPNTKIPEQNGHGERHESWVVIRRGHHWLHCVSHKSGVPMWILSSVLFLSSFFLLWLCCASTTARSNKKPAEKKAFLIKDLLPVSKKKDGQDVPLLKLDDDEEQAGPLPSKTGAAFVINM